MTAAVSHNFRDTTGLASVLHFFQQQVRNSPLGEAVVFERQSLNFAQLDALANQFAVALIQAGVGFGQAVGLSIDRRPEAIAAMLGAFKIGAVFVPLDPEYPLDRIRFMIEDADIRVIVTHAQSKNTLASRLASSAEVTWVDSATVDFGNLPSTAAAFVHQACTPSGSDLAYVMYTSGSTGKPKGVQIEHQALTTYCLADIEVYGLTAEDRTLQFSTLNFDIAIEEIFPPLLSGSCVVIRPSERADSANELSAIIKSYGITAVHLATAYWHEWVDLMVATNDQVPASCRLVIATGEKVSVEHFRRWQVVCDHKVLWCNAYGPTEATVTSTVFIPAADFDGENMPIGKPLPGYECFVLSSELKPVAEGDTGELFIAGPALARGYLNRPDLTEKAFLFVNLNDRGQTRLYRTGDLARLLPDGNIEFAGRVDHQIKLGSYRIEPGEIEAVLCKHPQVLNAIVVHEQVAHEHVAAQKHLIAYVATGSHTPSISQLANYLSEQLPAYMVPPRYVLLESLPTTINGKIDRAALPSPEASSTAVDGSYIAPRSQLERQLAEIWQRVLHLPLVGIHDDFFALGGSSLLAARVITELRQALDVLLPVRDLFANPTIATAARHLQRLMGVPVEVDSVDSSLASEQAREQLPIVEPGFIGPASRQLFSVRYRPRNSWKSEPAATNHSILICNSYGHEHTRAYRNLQQLALRLCTLGFDVWRFDYFGTGNSAGKCDACRADTFRADTELVAAHVREATACERLSLIGIRVGATVAATAEVPNLHRLILWDPVVDGRQLLKTFQQLHHYALNSRTRFSRRVKANPGQLFGHAMNDAKFKNLADLKMPANCGSKHLVLASRGYHEVEPGFKKAMQGWQVLETSDDIYWHEPSFTECAFSSPDAMQKIATFLTDGEHA